MSDSPRAWRRLSRGQPRDYRILTVREDRVESPRNQAELTITVVESPDWVNVIPVTRERQVVFIRQFRFGTWGDTLEVPGGVVEPGEEPAAAAARELEEETGFVARELVPLGFVHPNPAFQTNRCHSFLALGCEKVHDGRQDDSEDIAVELRPAGDADALIRSGQVTHSLVLTAFYLARLAGRFPPG